MKMSLSAVVVTVASLAALAGAPNAFADDPAKTEPAQQQPATEQPAQKTEQPKEGTTPAGQPTKEGEQNAPADQKATDQEKKVYVKLTTSQGDIVLELDNEKAPISTQNFVKYTEKGFYDGTIFHRVIGNFMIQGGGFTPDMAQKPTDSPIKNEWKNGLKNKRGTVAMARTQVADSATSQFFINVVDNPFLDEARDGAAYAVFGRVVAGMDTVDKIRAVKTGRSGMHSDVPVEPVLIEKATVITADEAKVAGSPAPANQKK